MTPDVVVPESSRQIIAMGGNGYANQSAGAKAMLRYIVGAAKKSNPKVLFVGAARGNNPAIDLWFFQQLAGVPFQPSTLNFFSRVPRDLASLVFGQDVVFIAGGMEAPALALFHEYGFDQVLKVAWQRGVVLSGVSFGAMCWFDTFLCYSYSSGHEPVDGLGIIKGSLNAHDDTRPNAASKYRRLVETAGMAPGYAIAENSALHITGSDDIKALVTDKTAACYKVSADNGKLVQTGLPVTDL